MLTVYLEEQFVRDLVDVSVAITILTEMEVLSFFHWIFRPGPHISGVGGQQDSKLTTWKDLDGNKRAILPLLSL